MGKEAELTLLWEELNSPGGRGGFGLRCRRNSPQSSFKKGGGRVSWAFSTHCFKLGKAVIISTNYINMIPPNWIWQARNRRGTAAGVPLHSRHVGGPRTDRILGRARHRRAPTIRINAVRYWQFM